MREIDRRTIQEFGIPGLILMEHAGKAVAQETLKIVSRKSQNLAKVKITLLCGGGNNGGDGFVAARFLWNVGIQVFVALTKMPGDYAGDARTNLEIIQRLKIPLEIFRSLHPPPTLSNPRLEGKSRWETGSLPTSYNRGIDRGKLVGDKIARMKKRLKQSHLIVDALLGTGSTGILRDPIRSLIQIVHESRRPVVAVDVPSGLDSDTGHVADISICAQVTVTMGLPKVGLANPQTRKFVGKLVVADIGIPRVLLRKTGYEL